MPDRADAIPAFARKYRMSCTTCHAPAPRLKEYGEDFAGNAFRLPDKEEPKRYFYDTGDDLLMLQRELPLAVRLDAYFYWDYREVNDRIDDHWDLKTPWAMKLMSGGNLASWIGYYFYFYMSERGEVAGIEDAYVHFNNLFGVDLDCMAGQFQVSDPLFKRELRMTYEDYECYKFKVGRVPSNLAYDRGIMLTYGSPVGLDVALEVVNGNGKEEAGSNLIFDSDDFKNVLLRLSQAAGPVRVGWFGYLGKTQYWRFDHWEGNILHYWGVDGTIDFGDRIQINGQFLERYDENPFYYVRDPMKVMTRGGMVEVIWAVNGEMGRPFVVFLYNNVESEYGPLDYRSETLNFSYLLRRNLRLMAETTFMEEGEKWRFVSGFTAAF
ncbi:MAG: hypothetical protein JSV33_13865 [bacterium]|nr:MAG: hypothetical protein JSV33_13865 [bacterium]